MDASVNTPSTRYALGTAIILLGVPIATFGVAVFATLKAGVTQPGWGLLLLIYAVGTVPGLIIGTRYPASATARVAFALGYVVVCVGMLLLLSLAIGCWVTNVCL